MNHIGTHDTERAITKIAGEKSDYRDRQWQSEHFCPRRNISAE